jgi:3-hydroxyisobutyrate dehydrogenase-like beta-hydroxyacid dehydrogenase
MLDPNTPNRGALRIGAKDIGLACGLAAELEVPAPLFDDAMKVLHDALAMGLGEVDLAALARAVERRAGVSISAKPSGSDHA